MILILRTVIKNILQPKALDASLNMNNFLPQRGTYICTGPAPRLSRFFCCGLLRVGAEAKRNEHGTKCTDRDFIRHDILTNAYRLMPISRFT